MIEDRSTIKRRKLLLKGQKEELETLLRADFKKSTKYAKRALYVFGILAIGYSIAQTLTDTDEGEHSETTSKKVKSKPNLSAILMEQAIKLAAFKLREKLSDRRYKELDGNI